MVSNPIQQDSKTILIFEKNSGGHTHSHSAAHHIRTSSVIFYNISALGHRQVITMNTLEATQEQHIRRV